MGIEFETPQGTEVNEYPSLPPGTAAEIQRRQRLILAGVIGIAALILIGVVIGFIYLSLPNTPTERIRDIMIIFLALEFMIIGLALVILIIQLATLINLLQNEVKPLLETTNETMNTLRGTTLFLSENLTEPIIKINEYTSGMRRLMEIFGVVRR